MAQNRDGDAQAACDVFQGAGRAGGDQRRAQRNAPLHRTRWLNTSRHSTARRGQPVSAAGRLRITQPTRRLRLAAGASLLLHAALQTLIGFGPWLLCAHRTPARTGFARRIWLFRHTSRSAYEPACARSRQALGFWFPYAAFRLKRARNLPIFATPDRRRSRNSIVLSCVALSFSQ